MNRFKILLTIIFGKSLRLLNSVPYSYKIKRLLISFLPRFQTFILLDDIYYYCDSSDYHEVCLLTDGEYEKETNQFLINFCESKSSGIFVDVGAHNGGTVLPVAKRLSSNRNFKAVALEPSKNIHQRLSANIAINGLNSSCIAINAGCSDTNKESLLFSPPSASGRFRNLGVASVEEEVARDRGMLNSYESVKLYSLDALYAEKLDEFGLDIIACKIDVEGHELSVLKGMSQILLDQAPMLIVEYNVNNFSQIQDYLQEFSYVTIGSLQKYGICPQLIEKNIVFLKL